MSLLLTRRLTSCAATLAPLLRVAIAGGGIAGCIFASELKKEPRIEVDVFEQRPADVLPAGLNLLLNHNGMAALLDTDPVLEAAVRGRGHDVVGWSARTMAGHELYDIADVEKNEWWQHTMEDGWAKLVDNDRSHDFR